MNDSPLSLTQDFLSGSKVSRENIALVRQANRHFDLGLDPQTLSIVSRAPQLCGWLIDCDFLSVHHVHGLLYDMEENGGRPVDREARADAKLFRRFGWDALASVIDDLFDLVNVTPLTEVFSPEGLAETPQSNELEEKLAAMQLRWRQAMEMLLNTDISDFYSSSSERFSIPTETLLPAFAEKLGVTFIDQADFDQHWVERIIRSEVFQNTDKAQSRMGDDLTGDLTDKIIASLSAKGFHVEFVFWQRTLQPEDAERGSISARGSIYAQTSNGPILIYDPTDNVSLRTFYPVDVFEIGGKSLFTITEEDDLGSRKSSWIADMLRSFSGRT